MKSLIPILVCLLGCQPDQGELDKIEAQLKDDPTRGGKVGTLVGLNVRKHAASLAKGLTRPLQECGLAEGARQTDVSMTVARADTVLQSWSERRWYNAHAGALRIDYNFTENGTKSSDHRLLWQKSEDTWLTRTGLDEHWYRRRATSSDAKFLRQNGVGVGQTLLNAVSGWSSQGDKWVLGGVKIVCEGGVEESTGWLQRFEGRVAVRDASMTLQDDTRREIEVSWTLSDGTILSVVVVEQVVAWEPESAGDILPEIPSNTIDERLHTWQKLGLIALRPNDE